jgi:predicted enzyme involved in methoxymalonyl-ACP biosynthesis
MMIEECKAHNISADKVFNQALDLVSSLDSIRADLEARAHPEMTVAELKAWDMHLETRAVEYAKSLVEAKTDIRKEKIRQDKERLRQKSPS